MPRTATPSSKSPVAKRRGESAARDAFTTTKRIDTTSKAGAALIDPDKPLTDMQKLFVKNWAEGESITTASWRAGYTDGGSYGYRMAAMPNIQRAYATEKAAYEEAAQMSRKKVMDMLVKAYDHAELAQEPASMVSAAREIGKMCGYYEPVRHKVDVSVNGTVIHKRMSSMSDSELLALITGGKALEAIEGE